MSQSLPTLAQLNTLNLSGNLITPIGIKYISSMLEHQPNCLAELKELYLSYNPLQNQSLISLSSICDNLPELRALHLSSTELTNLEDFDLKFGSLVDLDLSYNHFQSQGLSKAIEKLNVCHLARLNVSFCCPDIEGGANDMVDNELKPLVESLVRTLHAGTCAHLEEIRLAGCRLNDVDCWRLLQPIGRSKVLRLVALGDNPQLTKTAFKHILETIATRNLHIEGCRMILTSLNELDVDSIPITNCPECITVSMPNSGIDTEEINILKKLWIAMSRGRGRVFVKGTTALLTLRADSYNKIWGHSLC